MVDGARRSSGGRWHVAARAALCSGLLACGGAAASGSPEAGLDGTAPGEADANPGDGSPGDAPSSPPDRSGDSSGRPPVDAVDAIAVATGDSGTKFGDAGAPSAPGDAAPPSPASATAYLGNPAHTNSVVDPSLAPPLAAVWSFEPAVGVTFDYPLIAGGRVYFVYGGNSTGSNRQLVAVDEHTGATIWGPVDLGAQLLAGHAYDGERVFSVDRTGLVRAFDAATGAASWTYALGGLSSAGQPTAYRGLLYVVDEGVLTALDEATGQVRWTIALGVAGQTSPAVTDDGVFVAFGCEDVYAFDRLTGSLLWHHLPQCDGTGAIPLVFERRLYVTELDPLPEHTDVYDALNGGVVASLPCFIYPAFDSGHAYCDQRTPLLAFDLTTGAQTWTFQGDGKLNLGPFAAAGTVYVASDSGMMFGVDESTGALAWSAEADVLGAAAPIAAGEGILLAQLYGGDGVVAYAHADLPDVGVTLDDGGAPAAPFTLVPSANPIALALDDANVYWADFAAGDVAMAPKSGGAPVVLWSSTTMRPRAIAVDTANVYVLATADTTTGSSLVAVPISGAPAAPLTTSPNLLAAPLAAGPSLVYWVDQGSVLGMPKTGGAVAGVVPGVPAAALAVDASSLYWSAQDGLHAQPLSGGPAALLGVPANPEPTPQGPLAAAAIAVDATNVYYAINSFAGAGTIGSIPIAGGPPTTLATGRPGSLMAIAVDDRNVYWVEGEGTIQQGAIAAVPKAGGRVAVLATGLSDPMSVAVDSSGVYFPSAGGGVGKIAK